MYIHPGIAQKDAWKAIYGQYRVSIAKLTGTS